MIDVTRTFTISQPMDVVVGYLRDFAHAQAWDPGTKSCVQETEGPVVVGTTWHNVSEIKGRETELTYTLQRSDPDHLTFEGKNKSATSTDDLTFVPQGDATTVTYHATIDFHGIASLAGPFLKGEFEELGDRTAAQMTSVVNAL